MKIAIVVFPGTNRERDTASALQRVSQAKPVFVWHKETQLPAGIDAVILPGGFSWGDYLRCGAVAARAPVMREISAAAGRGVPVLGICNGFQILLEAGLLPGILIRNIGLKFIARLVSLKIENSETPCTRLYRKGQMVRFPVAHNEGNYRADAETLARLEGDGRVVLRYADAQGGCSERANINGSVNNIAGIVNAAGNVVGLMPHPENAIEAFHGSRDGTGFYTAFGDSAGEPGGDCL